jgi:hypothetical protein
MRGYDSFGGLGLTVARCSPLHCDGEDEEKVGSERGDLEDDLVFWGKDGQPYDEVSQFTQGDPSLPLPPQAADWEASGQAVGEGGFTVEELLAASATESSAREEELNRRCLLVNRVDSRMSTEREKERERETSSRPYCRLKG